MNQDHEPSTLMLERKPKSIRLDLYAIVHFTFATLFLIGPATDLGGLIWFPFYLLGVSCLIVACGIWLRRSWSMSAAIAVSVLFPVMFAVGFWCEWHAESWSVLGYGFSLIIVAPVYVMELAGIWLLVPRRRGMIDATSLSGQAKSKLLERVIVTGLLALAVLTDCVMPRRPNLYPTLVTAIGLFPAIIGLCLMTTNEKSFSRLR